MATFDCTGVESVMFEDDVVITKDGETYSLPANTAIGIPNDVTSLTLDIVTVGMCMSFRSKDLQVLTIDFLRAATA